MIHRDVKPDNILVAGSGKKLLLTDFGLSMWLGKRQKTTSVCGTLPFMAPEVLAASVEHPYGHSADFWSLGKIFFGHFEIAFKVPPRLEKPWFKRQQVSDF